MATLAVNIRQLLSKTGVGIYLQNSEITIPSTTTFTCATRFANTGLATNALIGHIVWRPTAANATDYVRYITALDKSTGTFTVDRAWTDSTLGSEDIYLLAPGVHPYDMISAANAAANQTFFENIEPLSLAKDAGFQSTAVTDWTQVNGTLTKVTTASSDNVFSGIGSGKFVNSLANGYFRQRFDGHPGEQVKIGVLARSVVGTGAYLSLWDVTNGAQIGSTVTHTGTQWAYLWIQQYLPSGCESFEVRLGGVGASDETYWNALWVYRTEDHRIRLSSTWDTSFKIPALSYATFDRNVSQYIASAFSLKLQEVDAFDYSFVSERPGANPYALQFHNYRWVSYPLYIQGRRPLSDITTFAITDLTTEVAVPSSLFVAEMTLQLLNMGTVNPRIPDVDRLLQTAFWDREEAAKQYMIEGPAKKRRYATSYLSN